LIPYPLDVLVLSLSLPQSVFEQRTEQHAKDGYSSTDGRSKNRGGRVTQRKHQTMTPLQ
jgi:hypothetical protein